MLKDKIQAPWISKDHCVFFAGLSGGFDIRSCPHPVEKARLIAAAPDLLAALLALTSNPHGDLGDMIYHVKEREGEGWDGAAVTAWSDAVTAARAAILKATGGSQ